MKLGAYAVERDYSHYVAYAAKTIFAVVSTATKGPIGVPTVCTSTQDLVNKFGPLNPKCMGLYAGQYFLSQSSKLYFVRAAGASVKASTAVLSGKGPDANTTIEDAVTLEFLEKGTYYDGYTVRVDYAPVTPIPTDPNAPKGEYTFTISTGLGATLEVIKVQDIDISNDIKELKSNYIRVSEVNASLLSINPTTVTFSGGNDGIDVSRTVTTIVTNDEGEEEEKEVTLLGVTSADYVIAGTTLAADNIDMNLFAVPGVTDYSVITSMLALAENRGDCLYLVDAPAGYDRDGIVQWVNGTGEENHIALNSSYGALYYDWITIYDSYNKTRLDVPPSVLVSATYAYSDRISEVWYAPAGLNRGLITGAIEAVTQLSRSDVEYLYENNINSIYDDPQVGLVAWGQKTLSRASTALDRVNVRRLMNYLKRVVTAACNYLTFEPNDRITWNSFEMKVLPLLNNIQSKRGLYEYRIVKGSAIVTDEDIDNYKLPCMIAIRPTKAAEEIPIYFSITSTGAEFNEVLEANGVVNI